MNHNPIRLGVDLGAKKDKDSVNYDIGIEFLDMPEKDWELLSGFVFLYDHIDEGA